RAVAALGPRGGGWARRAALTTFDTREPPTTDNGGRRQSARLGDMIFDVGAIIEAVTACVTLEPGDLIATGTPAGVGIGFSPQRFLKAGDEVRVSISGIGELVNPVS